MRRLATVLYEPFSVACLAPTLQPRCEDYDRTADERNDQAHDEERGNVAYQVVHARL
jgi:hypothetical protein